MIAEPAGSWYDRALTPKFAALGGLALAPSFVLGSSLAVVMAQLSAMLLLASAARVRLRPVRTVTFIALVVAFNLLSPAGRVLLTVASIPITVGALSIGLERAATLTSLLLLSKLAIRPGLELPGRIGALTTLTLSYLRELLTLPVSDMVRRPIERLDELLLRLHRHRAGHDTREAASRSARSATATAHSAAGVSGVIVIASWMAVLFT